jgi:hypothetical protein
MPRHVVIYYYPILVKIIRHSYLALRRANDRYWPILALGQMSLRPVQSIDFAHKEKPPVLEQVALSSNGRGGLVNE